MLINLSNHPSNNWSRKQILAVYKKFGKVVDLPFPNISPKASSNQVRKKAEAYLKKITSLLKKSSDKNNAVHLMGEFTFVILLYEMLKKKNISVIVSTSQRIVEEHAGKKTVVFNFIKFRKLK